MLTIDGGAARVTPSAYIDVVQLREGENVAVFRTYDVLSAFDSELRNTLLQTLADRLTAEAEAATE